MNTDANGAFPFYELEIGSALFILYGDRMVPGVPAKERDNCIAALQSGGLYENKATVTLLLDNSFSVTSYEKEGRFLFLSQGKTYERYYNKSRAQKILAWLVSVLGEQGYKHTVVARPKAQLAKRFTINLIGGLLVVAVITGIAYFGGTYRGRLAFVAKLAQLLGPVATGAIAFALFCLGVAPSLVRLIKGDNVVTIKAANYSSAQNPGSLA